MFSLLGQRVGTTFFIRRSAHTILTPSSPFLAVFSSTSSSGSSNSNNNNNNNNSNNNNKDDNEAWSPVKKQGKAPFKWPTRDVKGHPARDEAYGEGARGAGQGSRGKEGGGSKKSFWMNMLLFIPAGISFGLGMWQVRRRDWKLGLIAEREDRVSREVVALTRSLPLREFSRLEFRRVTAEGKYLPSKSLVVTPRFPLNLPGQPGGPSRDGVHLITPFLIDGTDGDVIMVNRGWVPRDMIEKLGPEKVPTPTGKIKIRGIARSEVDPGKYGPRNGTADVDGKWNYIDPIAMCEALGLPPSDMVVDLAMHEENVVAGNKYPLAGQTPIQLKNTHLEYAITWFTLAGAVAIGAMFRLRSVL